MDNVIVTWVTENINITLVMFLLVVGAVIKHWIPAIKNNYIPLILIGLGIVIAIVLHCPIANGALVIGYIVEGLASGLSATIVHSKGKDIINDLFNKDTFSKNIEDQVDKRVAEELEKLASIDFKNVDEAIDKEMGDETDNVDISDAINEVTKD